MSQRSKWIPFFWSCVFLLAAGAYVHPGAPGPTALLAAEEGKDTQVVLPAPGPITVTPIAQNFGATFMPPRILIAAVPQPNTSIQPAPAKIAAAHLPALPSQARLPDIGRTAEAKRQFDFDSLSAIQMMRAAANTVEGPTQSQLDIILKKLPEAPKAIAAPPAPVLNKPDLKPFVRPLPARARIGDTTPKARPEKLAAKPAMRPQSRPAPIGTTRKRPSFSAQHFHMLRHHGDQTPSEIACVAELQLIADRAPIYFESGSSAVRGTGASAARLVAAKAQSCPEAEISIIGFTDPGGSDELNLKLSWQRANAVYRSIEEAGFSTKRIKVSSHMEDHPEYCLHYDSIDRRVIFSVSERKE